MSSEIKAIFFDIGGTLVSKANSPRRDLNVISKMVELVNESCTPLELEERIMAGDSQYKAWRSSSFRELAPEERWPKFLLPDLPNDVVSRNARTLQALWSESRGIKKVLPEAEATLQELAKRGYVLGTISHTSPKYLESSGVLLLFKTIIHGSEFGWRKPHPAPFLEAARQSSVLPQQCAYVGDRPSRDVIGAREAGFGLVIQLKLSPESTESNPCPMQPDQVLNNLAELLQVFPGIAAGNAESGPMKTEPLLYDAALSSMWWDKPAVSAEDFFSKGRELGFARFELNHQVPPEVLAQINLDRYHIGSLHDPCPAIIPAKTLERMDQVITSLDETLRQRAVDGVKNTLEEAYRLAARYVVIHPGRIHGDHSLDDQLRELYRAGLKGSAQYEEQLQKVINDRASRNRPHLEALITSLHQIFNFANGMGLILGLENRFHYYELPIFDEMDTLLSEFQQPWVGWHLDVGHLTVLSELGLSPSAPWLEKFSSRIVGVHLHDVKGIVDHQAPGRGELDFNKIAAVLPPYCYRTIEVDKTMTAEEMAAGLKILAGSGCITLLSGGYEHV